MNDLSTGTHHSVFELFWHKSEFPWHFFEARYSCAAKKLITSELRHIVNVLSPGGLTWSVGMISIYDTAYLMDIGCTTWHHTLTCLKMSSKLLIYHADSLHSDHNVTLI